MKHSTRRKLLIYLGYAVSILLVYLAFRKVELKELGQAIINANYWWVIVNCVLVMVAMWYRTYRWKFMVDPIKKVSMRKLFASTMIGFMASNVLPLRLGEFVRAWSLGRIENMSRSAVMATVVVERIFDSFALLTFLTVILLFKRLPLPEEVQSFGYLFLVANVVALALLILLKTYPRRTMSQLERIFRVLPGTVGNTIIEVLEKFADGLAVMGDMKTVVRISVQSIILWTITGISNYFIFLAFGLGYLPIDASFVLLVIVSIGIMIPQSPGFVGGYHICVWYSLKPYGVIQDTAMAVAVVLHGAQYVVITLVGFYYLRREHLSLKEARAESISEVGAS